MVRSTSSHTLLSTTTLFLLLTSHALPALSFDPPSIPLNWTTQYDCAVDTPTRVLAGVATHQLASNNTPAACIALCDAGDFTLAGVEYADECHCGTGLVSPAPDSAPASECDMACTGDADLSCGGPWRIQVRSPRLISHMHVPLLAYCQPARPARLAGYPGSGVAPPTRTVPRVRAPVQCE